MPHTFERGIVALGKGGLLAVSYINNYLLTTLVIPVWVKIVALQQY